MGMLANATALTQLMIDGRKSPTALAAHINERVRRLLIAAQSVPFYREQMDRAGYDPARDFKGIADLEILRVTMKADLKAAPEAFVRTGAGPLDRFYQERTSGSTGIPLVVYRSPPERAMQIAKWLRVLFLSGYRPTHKVVSLTPPTRITQGRSVFQRFGLFRRLPVDYTTPPETWLAAFERYQPHALYGVRTGLLLLAEQIARHQRRVSPLRLVVATGEVIDQHTRRCCRNAFGVDITETYGSVETGVIAYQPRGANNLRLIEDCTHFEFLDADERPAQPGQLARVVVTVLHGSLMPFIRYDLGDLAIYRIAEDVDGTPVRVIERVVGRQDDLAPLPDGRVLTYLDFYLIMEHYPQVNCFRITQQSIDRFVMELVANPEYYRSVQTELVSKLRALSSLPLHFDMRLVNDIPPDPSGKRRILISKVSSSRRAFETGQLPHALRAEASQLLASRNRPV